MPAVAVVGAVASVAGGAMAASAQKKAAKRAAAAQVASDQMAIDEQRRQFDATRADLLPWQTAGKAALSNQGDLLGLNGAGVQQSSIDQLKNSPLYQSLFGNGQETILANAAATGGLRGGNTQSALANFGRDTLAGVIQQQVANLGAVSEQGQGAATQTGVFGANATNAISNLLQSQGQARAGAYLASGAAQSGFIKDAAGALAGLANNSGVQAWVGKVL